MVQVGTRKKRLSRTKCRAWVPCKQRGDNNILIILADVYIVSQSMARSKGEKTMNEGKTVTIDDMYELIGDMKRELEAYRKIGTVEQLRELIKLQPAEIHEPIPNQSDRMD